MEFLERAKAKGRRWVQKMPLLGDDAESICIMGLIDAAKHYVPLYQGFWKYASIRIDGCMRDYMRHEDWVARIDRKKHRDNPDFEIHEQVHLKPEEGIDIYQQLSFIDSRFQQIEDAEQVEKVLRGLTRQERRIVELYIYEGYTLREVGIVMGFSESRACQIWNQILELKNV